MGDVVVANFSLLCSKDLPPSLLVLGGYSVLFASWQLEGFCFHLSLDASLLWALCRAA
jgi:hypothetical protein